MPCPICNKNTVQKYRPFCSERCAEIDLGRWMTGAYRVETEELPEDDIAAMPDPDEPRH